MSYECHTTISQETCGFAQLRLEHVNYLVLAVDKVKLVIGIIIVIILGVAGYFVQGPYKVFSHLYLYLEPAPVQLSQFKISSGMQRFLRT